MSRSPTADVASGSAASNAGWGGSCRPVCWCAPREQHYTLLARLHSMSSAGVAASVTLQTFACCGAPQMAVRRRLPQAQLGAAAGFTAGQPVASSMGV